MGAGMSGRVAQESMYKDVFSIVLENDILRVVVLPEFGSKIASVVYKPLSQEILWQNPGVEYRRSKYGDPYLEGECSGFDEMFPTISRCAYESYPWQGIEMPDHGEVWALPWTWDLKDDRLRMRVNSIHFPYARLEDGRAFALDSVPARTGTGLQKYYFKSPMREGWCILYSSKTGINIGLRFRRTVSPTWGFL